VPKIFVVLCGATVAAAGAAAPIVPVVAGAAVAAGNEKPLGYYVVVVAAGAAGAAAGKVKEKDMKGLKIKWIAVECIIHSTSLIMYIDTQFLFLLEPGRQSG
jgi:hypothetical protein